MTTNKKCQQCSETCKQYDFIKVVVCPNFRMGTPHTGENTTLPYKNERYLKSRQRYDYSFSTHKTKK